MIGQTINNYTIESVLGEGGMGIVYLARHKYLDINSAVKVLHPQFTRNKQIKERFVNEALILSKLDSPYVVKVRDFFDHGENLFLVMEFVHGVPLDDYIHKIFGPVPEVRAREIFRKILAGVHAAHVKGIIHRDLKPSNILLENNDTPKILDFGIAKLVENDIKMTTPGSRMGSIIYMSPEQIMGRDMDTRTDIYSLGLLYYEMLTGKNPYDLPDITEYTIHSNIINNPMPSPKTYYPHITDHAEEIIARAVAKDPAQRFSNCELFIEALMNPGFLSGMKNTAFSYPPPPAPVPQPVHSEKQFKTSKELLAEAQRQTVLQTPSPTVFQQMPPRNNKPLYIIGGGFITFVIAAIIVFFVFLNTDDELNLKKKDVKEPVKKETVPEQKKDNEVKTETETKTETPPETEQKVTEPGKSKPEDENTASDEEIKPKQTPQKKKQSPPRQNNNNDNNTPTKKPRTTFEN